MSEIYNPTPGFSNEQPSLKPLKPIIKDIFELDPKVLGQLKFWLEGAGLSLPLSQITGYSNLTQSTRLTRTSNQSIGSSSQTAIQWDSVTFDTGGLYSSGSNTRLTIVIPGKYIVSGGIRWNSNGNAGNRTTQIEFNGTTIVAETKITSASTTQAETQSVTTLMDCVVGDYFELMVTQSSGLSCNVAGNDARTNFCITRTGP